MARIRVTSASLVFGIILICETALSARIVANIDGVHGNRQKDVLDDQYAEKCFGSEYTCSYSNYYDDSCTGVPDVAPRAVECGCPDSSIMQVIAEDTDNLCELKPDNVDGMGCTATEQETYCLDNLPCYKQDEKVMCSCKAGFVPADDGSCTPIPDEGAECDQADRDLCEAAITGGTCKLYKDGSKKCLCPEGDEEATPPLAEACKSAVITTELANSPTPDIVEITISSLIPEISSITITDGEPTTEKGLASTDGLITSDSVTTDISTTLDASTPQSSTNPEQITQQSAEASSPTMSTESGGEPSEATTPTETTPDNEATTDNPAEVTTGAAVETTNPAAEVTTGAAVETTNPAAEVTTGAAVETTNPAGEVTTAVETTTPGIPPTTADPCEGIFCHGNGECVDGACECEADFTSESYCVCNTEEFLCNAADFNCNVDEGSVCETNCNVAVCNCGPGLEWDEANKQCIDFNECQNTLIGQELCPDKNAKCENKNLPVDGTAYECVCVSGMVWDDTEKKCTLRNDCEDPELDAEGKPYECGSNLGETAGTCADTDASFTCECDTENGFVSTGNEVAADKPKCAKIDEGYAAQCFGLEDYSCFYSNYYDGSCEKPTDGDVQCTCPFSTMIPADDVADGSCKLASASCSEAEAQKCGDNLPCRPSDAIGQLTRCTCKNGFAPQTDGSCKEIAEGESTGCGSTAQTLCSTLFGANCALDKQGRKSCVCPEGHSGSPPLIACEPVVPSCANTNCDSDQYCDEVSGSPVCKCLLAWQYQNENGTCATRDPCNEDGGNEACDALGQFCRFDSDRQNLVGYTCACYPPLIPVAQGSSGCQRPFAFAGDNLYSVNFEMYVSPEEVDALSKPESPAFSYYESLFKEAMSGSVGDPTNDVHVTISTVAVSTAAPAGTTTTNTTKRPTTPFAKRWFGSQVVIRRRRSVIIDALMQRRLIERADSPVTVTLAVATASALADFSALENKLKQTSIDIGGKQFLIIGDAIIRWNEASVVVTVPSVENRCDALGITCPSEGYVCDSTPGVSSSAPFLCKCASSGLEAAGLQSNLVVENCRDINECERQRPGDNEPYCPTEPGYNCTNIFNGYKCECDAKDGYTNVGNAADVKCVEHCDPEAYFYQQCANAPGAKCTFIVTDEGWRVPECECPSDRQGKFCELVIDVGDGGSDTDSASVVGGVLGALLAVVVIIAGVTIYKLRKKARRGGSD